MPHHMATGNDMKSAYKVKLLYELDRICRKFTCNFIYTVSDF